MKILKSKDYRIKITLLAIFGVMFSCFWCCLLGCLSAGSIKKEIVIIALIVAGSLIFLLFLLCLILIKFEKKYYLIDNDGIKLYEKDKVIFELKLNEIISVNYVRFIWVLTFKMGSGYLHLEYKNLGVENIKFTTILLSSKKAFHSISMSLNQAKSVAKILNKNLDIK